MPRVLVVDDDQSIRELARINLEREGFEVAEAARSEEALGLIEANKFDMVVLDIMMPGMDGWDLCLAIRERSSVPLLMLTAMGQTADKIRGFQMGVDDYIVKPFDPLELAARVKAVLRRYRISVEQSIRLGDLVLDRKIYGATAGGRDLNLPRKEFELLFELASYPGKTLTRQRLIDEIWGIDYDGDERTVDVHIKRLRERFPEKGQAFRITTVRGLGYRLEVTG